MYLLFTIRVFFLSGICLLTLCFIGIFSKSIAYYLFLVIYDVRKSISVKSHSFILLCRWLILFVHCPQNLSQDYKDNNFSFPDSRSFTLGFFYDPSLNNFCVLNVCVWSLAHFPWDPPICGFTISLSPN